MGVGDLRWNMYSAAGWFAACMSIISIVLFIPGIFNEYSMAEKEAQWNKMRESQKQQHDNTCTMRISNIILISFVLKRHLKCRRSSSKWKTKERLDRCRALHFQFLSRRIRFDND